MRLPLIVYMSNIAFECPQKWGIKVEEFMQGESLNLCMVATNGKHHAQNGFSTNELGWLELPSPLQVSTVLFSLWWGFSLQSIDLPRDFPYRVLVY